MRRWTATCGGDGRPWTRSAARIGSPTRKRKRRRWRPSTKTFRRPRRKQRRQTPRCPRWDGGSSAPSCWLPAVMPARWRNRWRTSPEKTRRRRPLIDQARRVDRTAKDERFLELLRQSRGEKMLVFATFRRTLEHLQRLLATEGVPFSTYSGAESESEKDAAVAAFCQRVPVMLCSESGGEGRNLQFANTLVNFDLPWNPMRIEQRVGRIHRIGQTRDVFIFNLCTAGSLEARILALLDEKIRMFELVVGEVGSILGNLQGGEEFESLVLDLWLRSHDDRDLQQSFDSLGQSLLYAQEEYLRTKRLDEALFGEEFQ